jgi:DNA-binding transcriptional MerR regulator
MEYFSIGKVSKIVDLPQSVLRYWESVFDILKPYKSEGGTRRYTQRDIDLILEIKNLLYAKKYTIAGAQDTLSDRGKTPLKEFSSHYLKEISDELDEIIKELN